MSTPADQPLIRTKLAPPKVGSAPVSRDALLAQLDAGRDRKLAVVLGPAGCGKTMLLTQWRRQLFLQGAKVAWFNAAPDDDEAQTAAYLVESLRQAGLTLGDEAMQLYARTGGKAWKPLLAALINGLGAHDGAVYLVVDDFHYLRSFSLLQLIDRWIALAPENFHLIVGSRTRPPLDISGLRAADQLTELQFGELRFSVDETRRFVETQGLSALSTAHIRRLHEMTDGWAAGLQLLAFSLRKHKSPETLLDAAERLSLSQERALDDYLDKAVAEHLSTAELAFLTRICACRRFNRELCEVLTGDPSAADYLARFEADSLFLIPIDTSDEEPWYRFHRLFSSFLNTRLQRLDAAEQRKLHQLASHWFAGKNLSAEAMRHAALAEDADFLVELIDRAARPMLNAARFVELLKWCDAVPRERLRSRLDLCLCMGWSQLSSGRIEDFERTIVDIEHHPDSGDPQVHTEIQLLKAYHAMRRDDTAASLAIVEPMLEQPPPVNVFHSLLLLNIAGLTLVYANQFERARELARRRHRYAIPDRPDRPRPLVDIVLGFSYLVEGRIGASLNALSAFMDRALRAVEFGVDAAGLFAGYLLEAYWQSGQIQAARDFLDRYGDLVEAVGVADGLLFTYRVRARIERLDGRDDAARQTLQRLEETGYRRGLDRLVAWSLYEQADLARQAGNSSGRSVIPELLQRLDRLAEPHRAHTDAAWSEIPLAALLARAESAFDAGTDASCLPAIDAADACARANGRQLWSTRLGLMRAIALYRNSRSGEALRSAHDLVRDAAAHGMARVLADLGTSAQPLIAALLADNPSDVERDYLQTAASIAGNAAPEPFSPSVSRSETYREATSSAAPSRTAPGTDLLTARERDVLNLLAKALSMKGIARALDLSPGTVKWHLKNVYGKLGASSREDALAKARVLGLVE